MTNEDMMEKFFFTPKSIDEIIGSATIVVDTNVLLSAYQWKEASFKEVLDVLTKAANNDRLKIPMHVLEEFIDQRPKLIQSALERLNTDIYSKIQKPNKLTSTIPLIGLLPEHDEYLKIENEYLEHYKSYRGKIEDLSTKLKSFFQNDPVLKSLKVILETACFTKIDKHDKSLNEEANNRLTKRLPPLCGGDAGKKENKFGDYYIWKDILSIKNDVIFVSTDFKEDWYYLDKLNKPLSPRRELVEEFYEINKRTCCIISLTDYIKASVPSASEEVINDLLANQNLQKFSENNEQIFQLKYLITSNSESERLAYELYSVLYNYYDVKIFAHSVPYLDVHNTKYEYMYIKIVNADFKITNVELLNAYLKFNKSNSYNLKEIEEISNTTKDIVFTNLNGKSF
jgi:hypothetical protein